MSQQWECYVTELGHSEATVYYNSSLTKYIDTVDVSQCYTLTIYAKNKHHEGSGCASELKSLLKIERQIITFFENNNAIHVGKVNTGMDRKLYFYSDIKSETVTKTIQRVSDLHQYSIEIKTNYDPDKDLYWERLLPNAYEWQLIQNNKLISHLRKTQTNLEAPKKISHNSYFNSEDKRDAFIFWLQNHDFHIDELFERGSKELNYGVQYSQITIINEYDMNEITYRLIQKSTFNDGQYDCWRHEAPVHQFATQH